MPVITKTFNFNTPGSTDGWNPIVGGPRINAYQKVRDKRTNVGGLRALAPASTLAGSLRMTAKCSNAYTGNNYWELVTTWEDLGVPTGSTITTVKLDYLFRWEARNSGYNLKPIFKSSLEISGPSAKAGPAELWDVDSDLIGTFSTSSNCIDRTNDGNLWNAFPDGIQTAHPIQQTPMWKDAPGQYVNVATPLNASTNSTPSNSTIRFRLNNQLPSTPDLVYNVATNWLRFKNDAVTITMNYTLPNTGTSPIIMLSD